MIVCNLVHALSINHAPCESLDLASCALCMWHADLVLLTLMHRGKALLCPLMHHASPNSDHLCAMQASCTTQTPTYVHLCAMQA
jgi:hypothetical protein